MTVYAIRQPKGIRTGGQFAASRRSEPGFGLCSPRTKEQALNLATLKPGTSREIGAELHEVRGVDTMQLTNHGPGEGLLRGKNLIEMRFTLPSEANIAGAYEDSTDYHAGRHAALHAAYDQVGMAEPCGNERIPGLPEDRIDLDDEGNLTFVQYDSFHPGENIDPEDLASWCEGYDTFSTEEGQRRLAGATEDRLHNW